MVAEATAAMTDVDLILFVIEVEPGGPGRRSALGPGDRFILESLPRQGPPVVLVVNKIDRARKSRLLPLVEEVKEVFPFREILLISALTGDNAGDLPARLLAYLPEGPPLFPAEYATDQTARFMASELIREKLLHHTRQEIPHETCVLVEEFQEREDGLRRIHATILVEKESQRKIIIGREGGMLKRVGTEARLELESLLGGKVYLELWVKVRQGWRDDVNILTRLGLRKTS